MALLLKFSYCFLVSVVLLSLLIHSCFCFNPKLVNVLNYQSDFYWSAAGATWYGNPDGAGSDDGACGYQHAVDQQPFSSLVAAGGPSLFNSGTGCGACYEVRCNENEACSGKPVSIVITDESPAGGSCSQGPAHFDLSGTAFGAMAMYSLGKQLRDVGVLQIQYRRIKCNYPGISIVFHVDSGSNPNYFASLIEYENGDGTLSGVDLKQALDSDSWLPMEQSWGAVWKIDTGSTLKAPFSLKLIGESGKTIIANNVIPAGWNPGKTYRSTVKL